MIPGLPGLMLVNGEQPIFSSVTGLAAGNTIPTVQFGDIIVAVAQAQQRFLSFQASGWTLIATAVTSDDYRNLMAVKLSDGTEGGTSPSMMNGTHDVTYHPLRLSPAAPASYSVTGTGSSAGISNAIPLTIPTEAADDRPLLWISGACDYNAGSSNIPRHTSDIGSDVHTGAADGLTRMSVRASVQLAGSRSNPTVEATHNEYPFIGHCILQPS